MVKRTGVRLVIDLDGRYLHDPFIAEGLSLVGADDSRCDRARVWIERWIDIADEVGASVLTFGGGRGEASEFVTDEENLNRLTDQLKTLIASRPDRRVQLAIRPAIGDVIGSVARYERLTRWLGDAVDQIGLAADVGEMLAAGEMPVSDRLIRQGNLLRCVYLCDRSETRSDPRSGEPPVHVDLHRIITTLAKAGYTGPGIVRVDGAAERGLMSARESASLFE